MLVESEFRLLLEGNYGKASRNPRWHTRTFVLSQRDKQIDTHIKITYTHIDLNNAEIHSSKSTLTREKNNFPN